MAALLVFVISKCYPDLTWLSINNQYPFLHCHATSFIPASGGNMDWLGHLLPQIHIKSHSNVNLYHVFLLEGLLMLY